MQTALPRLALESVATDAGFLGFAFRRVTLVALARTPRATHPAAPVDAGQRGSYRHVGRDRLDQATIVALTLKELGLDGARKYVRINRQDEAPLTRPLDSASASSRGCTIWFAGQLGALVSGPVQHVFGSGATAKAAPRQLGRYRQLSVVGHGHPQCERPVRAERHAARQAGVM